MRDRIGRRRWLGLATAVAAMPAVARAQAPLVIFAAASLKNALDEIAVAWSKQAGRPMPRISYASSSTLAKQMEQGAPADLFVSADLDWMDYAQAKGLVRPDTRVNLLGNRIVLVAPRASSLTAVPITADGLSRALAGGRLATGNLESVPVGKYGKAALEKLGAWSAVKDHVAQAENARAALLLVSRGEAPLGLVYATDAAADPGVRIVATFPPGSHPPIVYPAALAKESGNADGRGFLDFLRGAAARAIFEGQGFTVMARHDAAPATAA